MLPRICTICAHGAEEGATARRLARRDARQRARHQTILRGYRGETGAVGKVRGFVRAQRRVAYAPARARAGLLVPVLCVSYAAIWPNSTRCRAYAALRETWPSTLSNCSKAR